MSRWEEAMGSYKGRTNLHNKEGELRKKEAKYCS